MIELVYVLLFEISNDFEINLHHVNYTIINWGNVVNMVHDFSFRSTRYEYNLMFVQITGFVTHLKDHNNYLVFGNDKSNWFKHFFNHNTNHWVFSVVHLHANLR